MVENYELDLAYVDGMIEDSSLKFFPVDKDDLVCVLSINNPLVSKKSVTLEELKKEETPENNVQEEIVENKETEEKKEDNDKTVEEDSMKFKKAEPSKKQKSNKVIPIVVSLFIVLFVMIFSVVFALFNMNNEKILKGISILGIDISDLTVEEAKTKINNAIEERFKDENNNLILKIGENETSVTANTFNAKFDIDNAVIEADNIGRNGNILTNNYSILFTKLFKKEIKPRLYLDDSLLSDTIKDINSKMKDAIVDNSYYIEKNNLIIVKGKAGYIIKTEELKEKIYEQISNIHTNYQIIEIPVEYKEPEPINLQKIHEEIYKEPQDAYVQKNPTVVHPEVNGVDFKISVEEAEELLKEDKEEYTIPLKITKPKKTINNLGEEAFPDLLATFSTRFDGSNYNRNTNIKLAAKKVNGTVILPGEKFSFNTIVGSRTIEAGFKEGTAYIGGKVVPDVGGGVCQVSSTIYNTALLANMQIVERSNHMFTTGYVAASRDATVYYGSLDFVFKNSRKYPIKMVASANGGVCKVSIYGIKEEKEYEVIIQSKITSYINPTTIYKEDPTLEEGKEIVEQTAITGCRSEGYKILKLNGKIVSQTLLSKDTYKSRNKIVRRGTKKTTTTPTKPANENRTNTETSNTTTNEPTTPETTENNTTE